MTNNKKKIAYILAHAPEYITTFIINEIEELGNLGMDITVFGTHKSNFEENPNKKNWFSEIVYAPSPCSFSIMLSHLYFIIFRTVIYFKLLRQYKKYNGKKVFWEGVYFSRITLKKNIQHLHAHFALKATDVARFISSLTGVSFSFTTHAYDLFESLRHVEASHFEEKLTEAKFAITCVKNNKTLIKKRFGDEIRNRIEVVYHGVDTRLFKPSTEIKNADIDILSIGRLVEKKGFEYLIQAVSLLSKKGLDVKCIIVGLKQRKRKIYITHKLNELISALGIKHKVEIINFMSQADLVNMYFRSKVFALPCIIDRNDMDGIPNVLAEAMAMELPVISTDLANIGELIDNGKDGLLIPDKNAQALSDSIQMLLTDESLRKKIGKNAREKIKNHFDIHKHILKMKALFDGAAD